MKFTPAVALIALAALMAFAEPARADNALITAGPLHTCALDANGAVRCWGDNSNGELGIGSIQPRAQPVQVVGLGTGMQAVAAKGEFSCALTTAGGVRCWGANSHGELGDGTTVRRPAPVPVTGLGSGVKAIAPGDTHTCALTTAGAVLCWGNNTLGQLGDGTKTQRLTPVAVAGLSSGVRAIASGGNHTCAVTTTGAVFCWGENIAGQLGDGTTSQRSTPVQVSGLSGIQSVSLGYYHSCALGTSGAVSCWGYAAVGSVGDGSTGDDSQHRLTPVPVTGLGSGVREIAAGYEHTCALTTAGAVQCWGWNTGGQLGDGTKTVRLAPVPVTGLSSGVQAIAGGLYHTCAYVAAGSVYCWGANTVWQLGDGTTAEHLTPVAVQFRGVLVPFDFNGDGVSDILWRNAVTGANTIWKSASSALRLAVKSVTGQEWILAGTGDFNADGLTDILWRNTVTGVNTIWKSANSGSRQAVTGVTSQDWQVAGVGDFDGDGTADILWRNGVTGANTIWRGGNSTSRQLVTGVTNVDWHVVAVGDFNSDGRADIFWRNMATGANAIWYSANAATSISVTGVTDLDWKVAGAGDFDGDGAADVLWHQQASGANVLWKSGNPATRQSLVTVTDTAWAIVAVGDYNGDGKSDILWRNGTSGADVIWRSAQYTAPQSVAAVTDPAWTIIGR
jgi:alpha-tubulin suppressor-like RCC1 family protein